MVSARLLIRAAKRKTRIGFPAAASRWLASRVSSVCIAYMGAVTKLAGCKTVDEAMRCADETVIHPIVGKCWEDPAYREFLEFQPEDRIGKMP